MNAPYLLEDIRKDFRRRFGRIQRKNVEGVIQGSWLKVGMIGNEADSQRSKLSIAYASNGISCGAVAQVTGEFKRNVLGGPRVSEEERWDPLRLRAPYSFFIYVEERGIYEIAPQKANEIFKRKDAVFFVRSYNRGFTFPYETSFDEGYVGNIDEAWQRRESVSLTARLTPYLPNVLMPGSSHLEVGVESVPLRAELIRDVEKGHKEKIDSLVAALRTSRVA